MQADDRERFRRLRDKLLPSGLMSTQRTYRDQSGQASMARSRLDAADWELMRRMPLPGGMTMADAVERWFAHAAKLGELENERAGEVAQQPTGAEILAARHGWIRAMRTLREALELRADLPESVQRIWRRLDEVVARAVRHRGEKGGGDSDIDIDPGPGDDIDGDIDGEPGDDIDNEPGGIEAAAEQVMVTGEVIEFVNTETPTGAQGGSGA